MKIEGWRNYKKAAIPTTAPHEKVNIDPINNGEIWKIDGDKILFARWTEGFDLDYETNWWYLLLDKPFDINVLKAKRRYEILKGNKNFDVQIIDPNQYSQELYNCLVLSYEDWPKKYRPKVKQSHFNISGWNNHTVFGAFNKEGHLCGFALVKKQDKYSDFQVLRTIPKYEKEGINAALIYSIVHYHKDFLEKGGYISDGERSIYHETNFQNYLEKYFLFRKAYCRLRLKYKPSFYIFVQIMYPFRYFVSLLKRFSFFHKIYSILLMEEIRRKEKNG